MSDLFHPDVPDEFISRVFAVMALCPEHTFQILTKRPGRMLEYLTEMSANPDGYCFAWARESFDTQREVADTWPLPNVWLGVSAEDQATADVRIPILLQTPAAIRFVSYEPALGPVTYFQAGALEWLICGAESGHGVRPMELEWARSALAQCRAAGVPFFMKQICNPLGRKIPFEIWPEDLKVREWPKEA
jgi:protein gp37